MRQPPRLAEPESAPARCERLDDRTLMSMSYDTSWVGNSLGYTDGKAVQNYFADVYVNPDGRVYANSEWDEGARAAGIYQNANQIGVLADQSTADAGGGRTITGDGQYVYSAIGYRRSAFRRHNLDGSHAPFSGGVGTKGNEVAVDTSNGNQVDGLAVDAARDRLFAVAGSKVYVFSTADLAAPPSATFTVTRPGEAAVAPDGTLWIISRRDATNGGRILHYSAAGTLLSQMITDAASGPAFEPSDLAFDPSGGKLYVADNGPDQQVKIYNTSSLTTNRTAPDDTFGVRGGVFAGTGAAIGTVGEKRFRGLSGVGVDPAGNLYVAQSDVGPDQGFHHSGARLESYKLSDESRTWELLGLEFIDAGDFDAASDTGTAINLYSKYHRYSLDLTKTTPGSEATYRGHLVNPFKYPNDVLSRWVKDTGQGGTPGTAFFRTLGGRKFMFVTNMDGEYLNVYRFNAATDGEVAIPSAGFSKDGSIWRDIDGDGQKETGETEANAIPGNDRGWFIDMAGDLWLTTAGGNVTMKLRHWDYQGIDSQGNPKWDNAHSGIMDVPAPFSFPYRVHHTPPQTGNPLSDTMFLTGYSTALDPGHYIGGPGHSGKGLGSVLSRYDDWSTGNRTATWSMVLPDYDRTPLGMAVAGDFIFVTYDGQPSTPDSGFIYAFRISDGGYVGKITMPRSNWQGRTDIEYAINAYKRSNGQYLIVLENDWRASLTLYRWTPPGSAPSAPAVAATTTDTSVTLTWPDQSTDGSWTVQRATSSGGPYTTLSTRRSQTGYSDTGLTTGTTYYYRVIATGARGDATSSTVAARPSLPAGWTGSDIGAPGQAGDSRYTAATGTWSVSGGGNDIWGTADRFQFARTTYAGAGSIVAKVESVPNVNAYAKAGVMFRAGTASNAANAFVAVTPSGRVSFQSRAVAGGTTSETVTSTTALPTRVKLTRSGSTFSGYYSTDCVAWTLVASRTITMPASVDAGLAVTAHDNTRLCAATFTGVAVGFPQKLARNGWDATASKFGGDAFRALDGSTGSRWATNGPQATGNWFQVDIAAARTFGRVVLDAGNTGDFPAAYAVRLSNDGINWGSPVATGAGDGRYTDVELGAFYTARYVRVTLTAGSSKYWGVAEFDLYG